MRRCLRVGALCAVLSVALCADNLPTTADSTSALSETAPASISSSSAAVETTSKFLATNAASSVTSTGSSGTSTIRTCQSKTANYITHTLPQQGLRSRSESVLATSVSVANGSESTAAIGGTTSNKSSHNGAAGTVTETSDGPTTASAAPDISPSAPQDIDTETDSPLDNVNFLSFEDWKKQNLEKAGQSPDNVGQGRGAAGTGAGRRRPDVGSLESLGEEGEIDFDFGGFVGMDKPSGSNLAGTASAPSAPEHAGETSEVSAQIAAYMRSKDAGKTCKERTNYASFDCGASILKTNPRCKSSSSVLVENKDSYMLNECAIDNKFLIAELCEDILVDTVVLANFEFFSSMLRTFRVSVSDRYPPKPGQWVELGTFEARNSREVQAFLVEGPRVWARYLRVELLTHYGNEYYCPVSLLRVHGITMMEEYKHEEERARGEIEQEEQGIEEMAGGAERVVTADAIVLQEAASSSASVAASASASASTSRQNVIAGSGDTTVASGTLSTDARETSQATETSTTSTAKHVDSSTLNKLSTETAKVVEASKAPADTVVSVSAGGVDHSAEPLHNSSAVAGVSETATLTDHVSNSTAEPIGASTNVTGDAVKYEATRQTQGDGSTHTNANTNSTVPTNSTATNVPAVPSTSANGDGATSSSAVTASEKSKTAPIAALPPAPSPSTQESFFKSVDKRLKALESNASLSLQYIEEQSRILRDAFTKVEKRQLNKTAAFLAHLNATVMTELRTFRTQYDQLWQSTVIELETHREQHQREMVAISSRLTLLADEVVFQKRMAVVQSTLLMLCLGVVLFVRSGTALDLPLGHHSAVHHARHKRAMTEPFVDSSPPNSPARPTSPVSGPHSERRSRISRFFSRTGSPASLRGGPAVELAGPTSVDRSPLAGKSLERDDSSESLLPEADDVRRLAEDVAEDGPRAAERDERGEDSSRSSLSSDGAGVGDGNVERVRLEPRHVRSGPATPQGTRDNPLAWDPAAAELAGASDAGHGVGGAVQVEGG